MPQYVTNGTIGVIAVPGSFNLQGGGTNVFKNNNLQFRDTLTWIHGRHEIKAGGEVLKLHFLQLFSGPPSFSFSMAGSRVTLCATICLAHSIHGHFLWHYRQ